MYQQSADAANVTPIQPVPVPQSFKSTAHTNTLTNLVKLAGIPISNTVELSRAGSTGGRLSGSFADTVNLGGIGLTTSLSSEKIGSGIGLGRGANGGLDIHVGGFNIELGHKVQKPVVPAMAVAVATGTDTHSNSDTKAMTKEKSIGLVDVAFMHTKSVAQATTSSGQTAAYATGQNAVSHTSTSSLYCNYY